MFDCHLRQQQTLLMPGTNEQTVLPDLHLIGGERKEFRQHGDFNAQVGDFVRPQRREARVAECSALGAMNDDISQCFTAFDDADAAAQFLANVDGHEGAAAQLEAGRRRLRQLDRGARERGENGRACEI